MPRDWHHCVTRSDLCESVLLIGVQVRVHFAREAVPSNHESLAVHRHGVKGLLHDGGLVYLFVQFEPYRSGDQQGCTRVIDPGRQLLGRKPAEHDQVDRPDPHTSVHELHGFRNHRQLDHDPVASAHSQVGEDARALGHRHLQLLESLRKRLMGLHGGVVEGRQPPVALFNPPIDAILRQISEASCEPLVER